jgi:hypothetical protein
MKGRFLCDGLTWDSTVYATGGQQIFLATKKGPMLARQAGREDHERGQVDRRMRLGLPEAWGIELTAGS